MPQMKTQNYNGHWFYTNSKLLEIYTYGPKDHPTKTYRWEDKRDFDRQVKMFLKEGYEFIRDQAK
jgi:hypothetical protein